MINSIIDASIKDRFLVLLAMTALAAMGLFSYLNAPLDAIPDLSDVQSGMADSTLFFQTLP